MTVPQAQQYYNNYLAQQQAQAQAEAEALQRQIAQQELTNQINLQKLANDTAKTNYDINKPYYKPTTPKTPTTKQYTLKDVQGLVNGMDATQRQRTIDYLYNTNQISDELFDYYQI